VATARPERGVGIGHPSAIAPTRSCQEPIPPKDVALTTEPNAADAMKPPKTTAMNRIK
jgi:hypothetical protein